MVVACFAARAFNLEMVLWVRPVVAVLGTVSQLWPYPGTMEEGRDSVCDVSRPMSWTCTGIADGTLDCRSARYLKVLSLQDLLTRLLERKPARRLGMLQGQANDVKNHPWFAGIDWDSLAARKLMAPRTPKDDAQKRLKDLQVRPLHLLRPCSSFLKSLPCASFFFKGPLIALGMFVNRTASLTSSSCAVHHNMEVLHASRVQIASPEPRALGYVSSS